MQEAEPTAPIHSQAEGATGRENFSTLRSKALAPGAIPTVKRKGPYSGRYLLPTEVERRVMCNGVPVVERRNLPYLLGDEEPEERPWWKRWH